MLDQRSPLLNQIVHTTDNSSYHGYKINPDRVNNINDKTSVNTNRQDDANIIQSYPWLVQKYKILESDLPPILDLSTLNKASFIESYVIDSLNGDLQKTNLDNGYLYLFRCKIFKNSFNNAKANIAFNGYLTVLNNNTTIYNSSSQLSQWDTVVQDLTTQPSISFLSGWNNIDILLYNKTTLDGISNFKLNAELGQFADFWEVGGFGSSAPAPLLYVAPKVGLLDKRDPNTAYLQWGIKDNKDIKKFNLYRSGPFLTGITAPTNLSISGYTVEGSGVLSNLEYSIGDNIYIKEDALTQVYYCVSTIYNDEIESEPTQILRAEPGARYSKINHLFISGYSTGTLSGIYTYVVTKGFLGKETFSQFIYTTLTGTDGVLLSWERDRADVDSLGLRTYESGLSYKIFRYSGIPDSLDAMFSPSASTFLTGIPVLELEDATIVSGLVTFIDSGLPTSTHSGFSEPPATNRSYFYTNNAFSLNWDFDYSSVADPSKVKFKIYRSFSSGLFGATNPPIFVTGNTCIDSGSSNSTVLSFIPVVYQHIATINNNTFSFYDQGLKQGAYYKYKINTVNYHDQEGVDSNSVVFVAGDTTPPAIPSGVIVSGYDSSFLITWQNGTDPDLYSTRIYESSTETGVFSYLTDAIGRSQVIPVGYSQTRFYKLTAIDLNGNESDYSSIVSGSTSTQLVPSGTGDVSGSGYSTDNAIVRWDGTTGKLVQNSPLQLHDDGTISGTLITINSPTNYIFSSSQTVVASDTLNLQGSSLLTANGATVDIQASNLLALKSSNNAILSSFSGLDILFSDNTTDNNFLSIYYENDDPAYWVLNVYKTGVEYSKPITSRPSGTLDIGSIEAPFNTGYFKILNVDSLISTGISANYVSKAGDIISGDLIFTYNNANPLYISGYTLNVVANYLSLDSLDSLNIGQTDATNVNIAAKGNINLTADNDSDNNGGLNIGGEYFSANLASNAYLNAYGGTMSVALESTQVNIYDGANGNSVLLDPNGVTITDGANLNSINLANNGISISDGVNSSSINMNGGGVSVVDGTSNGSLNINTTNVQLYDGSHNSSLTMGGTQVSLNDGVHNSSLVMGDTQVSLNDGVNNNSLIMNGSVVALNDGVHGSTAVQSDNNGVQIVAGTTSATGEIILQANGNSIKTLGNIFPWTSSGVDNVGSLANPYASGIFKNIVINYIIGDPLELLSNSDINLKATSNILISGNGINKIYSLGPTTIEGDGNVELKSSNTISALTPGSILLNSTAGNIAISGNDLTLQSNGNINTNGNLIPQNSGINNVGSNNSWYSTGYFKTIYVEAITGVELGVLYTGQYPIDITNNIISIPSGSSSVDGYISSGDWSVFNSKISSVISSGDGQTLVASPNYIYSLAGVNIAVSQADGVITLSGSQGGSFTGGDITGSITPTTNGTLTLGSSSKIFSGIYANQYATTFYSGVATTGVNVVNWNNGVTQYLDFSSVASGVVIISGINGIPGSAYLLLTKQNTGGTITIRWGSEHIWQAGLSGMATASASVTDMFSFVYNGSKYLGSFSNNYF